MNQLVLKEPPSSENGSFRVTGSRAEHIRTVLRAKPGDSLKVGLLNGNRGSAVIRSVEKNEVLLDSFSFHLPPLQQLPITLAVALPRPQSLKKVLHFSASAGIRELILFHSARVEKSYWNSTVLRPDSLEAELLEGLEQGGGTTMPKLLFYRSFRDFLGDANQRNVTKIVAHPVPDQPVTERPEEKDIFLAVGPEGGFLPSEVAAFENNGFRKFSCGSHILRVEFACAFLCGRLL